MGAYPSSIPHVQYGVWTGDQKPGETRILRPPHAVNSSMGLSEGETNNIWSAFEATVNKHGDRNFLGTRQRISKDKL